MRCLGVNGRAVQLQGGLYLICSLPGVMVNGTLVLMPADNACLATLCARAMSSYEELVQLPIKPAFSSVGHLFSRSASANCTYTIRFRKQVLAQLHYVLGPLQHIFSKMAYSTAEFAKSSRMVCNDFGLHSDCQGVLFSHQYEAHLQAAT